MIGECMQEHEYLKNIKHNELPKMIISIENKNKILLPAIVLLAGY